MNAALTPDEFAQLFQSSARLLWTIAAGVLGSPGEVDDVLQESAVQALGKLDQFEKGTSFTAWMGRFVRNVALNHGRKRYRQGAHRTNQHPGYGVRLEAAPKHLDELPHPAPAANDAPVGPDGRLHEDQVIFDDLLMAELREIAAVPRACLLMRSLLELSYREISEALDIPEGTAMSHVHRTRTQLRRRLGAPEEDPADTERRDGRRLRLDIATANLADSRSTIDAETR